MQKKKQLQIGKNKFDKNTPGMPEWFIPKLVRKNGEGR